MRNITFVLFLVFGFLAFCCSHKLQPPPSPPTLDKTWTLSSAPNALDVVGVVFAVDENGNYKSIPGGKLDVKVLSSPVAITERSKTKNVSLGLLVKFLAIRNIDSSTNASVYDTAKLTASFVVNEGNLSRIDDDILKAFNQKKPVIESNIGVLGLDKSRLFIILETIQSSNVSIVLNKNKKWGTGMKAKVDKIVQASGGLNVDKKDNSSLVYKNAVPVTVFYKLNAINVFKLKGPTDKYEVELGDLVKENEIIIKR